MHIDFAPPSKGTYNNAGSSRQLASYMEHEDLERMEKEIYTDGFFNLTNDDIYKSKVITFLNMHKMASAVPQFSIYSPIAVVFLALTAKSPQSCFLTKKEF